MCGIAGILSLTGRPVAPDELRAMCDTLAHRGPDDDGFHLTPTVGLGMRRLSIIDLETGRQPIRNEDGSVWAVLNGEIYNFRELRRELEARGHVFYTATDTEVIVHLYEDHGPGCVEKMRGMFAFAVWDARRQELLVARDRLGIKPLYYAELGGRLAFASELKAILTLDEAGPRLSWPAVGHLFAYLATPRAQSVVEGVRKLEPGHVLVATPGRPLQVRRYWSAAFAPERGRREAYFVERLRELLEESVRLHMVSDVPLGAFLSGGIDSSSMVALMAPLTSGRVKTFSIGFAERRYDELAYARQVAERFDTEHRELILEPDAADIIEDLAWYLDEPLGDPSVIPTYMVSKLAAESVTVVLSGDGGDEIFAGYDKYVIEGRERRREARLPGAVRRLAGLVAGAMPDGTRGREYLRHLALTGRARYLDSITMFRADQQARLFTPEAAELVLRADPWRHGRQWLASDGHWLSVLQSADLEGYLPLDILTKVDRMSMAHSIEARVPLLDHHVVEFAATIPPELQLHDDITKHVFRRAVGDLLPADILSRPKHGFAVPLGAWFRGRLAGVVRDLLLSDRSRQRGIFTPRYIEGLLAQQESGRDMDFQLWTLISFELWCRAFIDGRRRRQPADVRPWMPAVRSGVASGACR